MGISSGGGERSERDELLKPTVDPADVGAEERPWDPKPQVYVAFFGGVLAVTGIAYLNAQRLRLPERTRQLILLGGFGGLIAVIVATMALVPDDATWVEGSRTGRLASRGIAVLLSLGLQQLQVPAARVWQLRGDEFESLWKPGLVACAVGGILQALILFAVLRLT